MPAPAAFEAVGAPPGTRAEPFQPTVIPPTPQPIDGAPGSSPSPTPIAHATAPSTGVPIDPASPRNAPTDGHPLRPPPTHIYPLVAPASTRHPAVEATDPDTLQGSERQLDLLPQATPGWGTPNLPYGLGQSMDGPWTVTTLPCPWCRTRLPVVATYRLWEVTDPTNLMPPTVPPPNATAPAIRCGMCGTAMVGTLAITIGGSWPPPGAPELPSRAAARLRAQLGDPTAVPAFQHHDPPADGQPWDPFPNWQRILESRGRHPPGSVPIPRPSAPPQRIGLSADPRSLLPRGLTHGSFESPARPY